MNNVYGLDGKLIKVNKNFEQPIEEATYKEIMKIVVKYATEDTCKKIFTIGGVTMCPSEVFGKEIIDKEKEEYYCEIKEIGCSKCWGKVIKKVKEKQ